MNETLKKLLLLTAEQGASDLHLMAGRFPTIRKDGILIPLTDFPILTKNLVEQMIYSLLDNNLKTEFESNKELDFSFSVDDKARFRSNIYFQYHGLSAAFRYIPSEIKGIDELNLPPILHEIIKRRQGLILVTGPAGVGKSTTLAAFVDEINHSRPAHIITIEEPIEYIFMPDKAIFSQREIPRDALDWHRALKAALREDPDVIMIGELRDAESISIALTAAETGHLVLGTLHTNSASQTIDRILDVLPEYQKNQARFQLSASLVSIISQRLVPTVQGGRIPACEILIANSAIRNLIRENKVYQIDLVIETSLEEGMISLDRSLANLVQQSIITIDTALEYSLNPARLNYLLQS